ncbi:unnamed protein product [Rotaria sordida]|uniref:Uncharacterized protein n=1 Tax=Rotaria sordida TaxID=392033 RepID=A0A818PXH4_9BILA|nr:unnamed protein product [Rotaria sordida]
MFNHSTYTRKCVEDGLPPTPLVPVPLDDVFTDDYLSSSSSSSFIKLFSSSSSPSPSTTPTFLIVHILLSIGWGVAVALQCYSHDAWSINCPQLSNTTRFRTSDDNRYYKAAFPDYVSRDCAKERYNVQVHANSVVTDVWT